jgi:hypothetical protein
MSLEFMDSFDGYGSNEIPLDWISPGNARIISQGRNGKGLLIPSGGGVSQSVNYNNTWVVGFAFIINSSDIQAGGIYTAYTPGASNLCQIVVESDGSISLYTQGSGTPFANTGINNFFISTNTWYFIDITYTMEPTEIGSTPAMSLNVSGLRINKQTVLSGTTVVNWNYTNSLTAQCQLNQHAWGFFNGNPGSMTIDDLYIFNQNGSTNNAAVGDIKILYILPDQDVLTPFTAVGGTGPQYTCVNEIPPDYDNSYIYSNVNNTFENFNWQQLPAFYGNVICVQYRIFARKDDEGSRAFQHTMGSGPGTLSAPHYVGDSYLYYRWELDTGPGGATWTVALFNSTSFGIYVYTIPLPS